jgi:hypothetical protein
MILSRSIALLVFLLFSTAACSLAVLPTTPLETSIAVAVESTRLAVKASALVAQQTQLQATVLALQTFPATPSAPFTELPPTPTPEPATPTHSPTPWSFVIQDPVFLEYEQSCQTDVEITGVNGETLSLKVNSTLSIIDGKLAVFCFGAKHTWIGELTYKGYTFASSASDPLQFQVVQGRGYVYSRGAGVVTFPDGMQVRLPVAAAGVQ